MMDHLEKIEHLFQIDKFIGPPSFLHPSYLPTFLPSFLPSFPTFLPKWLPPSLLRV